MQTEKDQYFFKQKTEEFVKQFAVGCSIFGNNLKELDEEWEDWITTAK